MEGGREGKKEGGHLYLEKEILRGYLKPIKIMKKIEKYKH